MQEENILIFPFSGTGIEALDCLGKAYKCIGFVSDDENVIGTTFNGIRIFSRKALIDFPVAKVLAVPGSPTSFLKRKIIIKELNIDEDRFVTVIHPNAFISKYATIGKNVLIMAFVNIGPNVIIGNHICILPNTTIHHDSKLFDYTLVGGNVLIAGNIIIEQNCYIGAGSNIINGCVIGEETIVGLGSNVIRNIEKRSKVAGNPAKPIDNKY